MSVYLAKKNFNYDARDFRKGDSLKIEDYSAALYLMKAECVYPENWRDDAEVRFFDQQDEIRAQQKQKAELLAEGESIRAETKRLLTQKNELLADALKKVGKKEKPMNDTGITKSAAAASLETLVIAKRLNGESEAQTMLRLLQSDRAAQALYAAHELARPASLSEFRKAMAKDDPGGMVEADDECDAEDMAELKGKAKKIRKRDGCSKAEAFAKALAQHPKIYERMEGRKAATVR